MNQAVSKKSSTNNVSHFFSQSFFSHIEGSVKLFVKHWRLVVLAMLVDVVFFYSLTKIHVEFFLRIQPQLNVVMESIQKNSVQLQPSLDGITQLQSVVVQQADVLASYHAVIYLLGLMLLSLFGAWLVLQGLSWWLALRVARKEPVSVSQVCLFARRFALRTLLWFMVFVLLLALLSLGLQSSVSSGMLSVSTVYYLFLACLFVLGFLAVNSYAAINHGFIQSLRACLANFKQTFLAYVLALLFVFVTGGLAWNLAALHWAVVVAWIMLVFLPALTLARVYVVCAANSKKATESSWLSPVMFAG